MKKIVAQYNPQSGGSYHRVKLWSEFTDNVVLCEELTEDVVKDADIVYVHWTLNKVSVPQLSVWKETYGFKLFVDIDDTWKLEKKFLRETFHSKHLCLLADGVICTNALIESEIKEWNNNTIIIDNFIPFDEFTANKPKRDKLRVGIGGSISHLEDYMSLRHTIKHLQHKKWFTDNCDFAIIGYDDNVPAWKKVKSMFKDVLIFEKKSSDEYMSLYDELDIMILPLVNTTLNRGRSNLKVYECLAKNVFPVIDNLYFEKDPVNELLRCQKNFVESIKYLVEDRVYLHNQPQTVKSFLKNRDYFSECVRSRLNFLTAESKPEAFNHSIYSISYDNQPVEYERIENTIRTVEDKSYLFEYNVITQDRQWDKPGYVGYLSHKFPFKTGYYKKLVQKILDKSEADIVVFCRQGANYLGWTEQQHPGFLNIFFKICQKLGLPTYIEPKIIVYSNFFVAKPEIYAEYIKYIKAAIELMETDEEIKSLVWQNANYVSGLDSESLKKFTGLDYYTFHTFVLERLFSVFINSKPVTVEIHE